jgi:hypothetical protein
MQSSEPIDGDLITRFLRALISGGLGFIGPSTARALVQVRATVALVDSLSRAIWGNLYNIEGLEDKVYLNARSLQWRTLLRPQVLEAI